nr:preprotein translocase subunit SecG [uncultured Agitococcus sp.]
MESFVLVVHVIIASVMILFILMQQGKGAEAGASFGGGGSQTVFGSAGSASFLTKLTAGLAIVFFITSMTLAIFAKQKVSQSPVISAPVTQKVPANTDVPAPAAQTPAPISSAPASSDVPATVPAQNTAP